MYFELKENKPHGTKDDPFSTYHIKNEGRSFQIPVHWHDEFEIIYVKSGLLTVSISGESYIGKAGDAFLGISTSGNSENVMYAAVTAKAKGLKVIGLTGKTGGKLAKLADVAIIVPEQETYKIQELHLPIYHVLCLMLEDKFFGK